MRGVARAAFWRTACATSTAVATEVEGRTFIETGIRVLHRDSTNNRVARVGCLIATVTAYAKARFDSCRCVRLRFTR